MNTDGTPMTPPTGPDPAALLRTVNRALHAGRKMPEADAYVAAKSGGQFRTVAEVQAALAAQDMPQESTALGRTRAGAEGLTFGLYPQMVRGMEALGIHDPGTANTELAAGDQFAKEHPWQNAGAQIVGSAPSMLVGPEIRSIKAAMGSGALFGAVQGAGHAIGHATSPEDLQQHVWEPAASAALSAGGAAVMHPVLGALTGSLHALEDVFSHSRASTRRAWDLLSHMVENTGKTPQELAGVASKMAEINPKVTPADLDPQLQQTLAATARRSPAVAAQARTQLGNRNADFSEELARDLMSTSHVPDQSIQAAGDARIKLADADARHVYASLDPTPLGPPSDPAALKVHEALANPDVQRLAGPYLAQEGEAPTLLTLRKVLDRVKAEESKAYQSGSVSGGKAIGPNGERLSEAADQLEGSLREAFPEWAVANDQYARHMSIARAYQRGAKAASGEPEDLATAMASYDDPVAQSAFKHGAVRMIVNQIRSGKTLDRVANGSPMFERRLAAMFRNIGDFEKFMASAETRATLLKTEQAVTGGSPTANRQAFDKFLGDPGSQMPGTPGGGSSTNGGPSLPAMVWNKIARTWRPSEGVDRATADVAGTQLLTEGLPGISDVLQQVAKRQTKKLLPAKIAGLTGKTLPVALKGLLDAGN